MENYYIIDGNEDEKLYDADEVAYAIVERMDDSAYVDMLDEVYGEVEIAGISYSTSMALKDLDPTAFRCGRNDYYDDLARDMAYDIEHDLAFDEDEEDFYGFTVTYREIEDEEDEE